MDYHHPATDLKFWANETFPDGRYQILFRKIPKGYRAKHIKNMLHAWRSNLCEDELTQLDLLLAEWGKHEIQTPNLIRPHPLGGIEDSAPLSWRARERANRALSSGEFHPEGRPEEDLETQKLIEEGEELLRKDNILAIQQQILGYAGHHSQSDTALEIVSRSDWRRAGTLKKNNILPKALLDKVALLITRRKKAIRLYDAARCLNADHTDLQRWANAGKIETLGYRGGRDGFITLLDREALPTQEEIQKLCDEEAHLPESERVFGCWAQCSLLKRGWKKDEILKHLGQPDEEKENPHWKAGPPMKLYLKSRVLRAEEAGLAPAKPKDNVR